jgi:transcription elongation factor GreB
MSQAPNRSHYITRTGYQKLADELDFLWRTERPKVTREVSEAAAQGDRSENAEYIYGKKRLREIDSRMRFLQKRLDELTVVESSPSQAGTVFFGAWVTVEDEEGETLRYQLVGPDEFDATAKRISIDSPLGRSLLGKHVDDEFVVNRPKGRMAYTILAIEYELIGSDSGAAGESGAASKVGSPGPDDSSS